MRDGNVYELKKQALRTNASASFASPGDGTQKNWATPIRNDSKHCLSTGGFASTTSNVQALSDGSSTNRLNPAWAETLMGWPAGWSSAETSATLQFSGFPKGQGSEQHPYEASRTIHKDSCPGRAKRIAMIGNGVVPQQVTLAYKRLLKSE